MDRLNKRVWIDSIKGCGSTQDIIDGPHCTWDVKNDFAYVLQFFPLISDSLGSVTHFMAQSIFEKRGLVINEILVLLLLLQIIFDKLV